MTDQEMWDSIVEDNPNASQPAALGSMQGGVEAAVVVEDMVV